MPVLNALQENVLKLHEMNEVVSTLREENSILKRKLRFWSDKDEKVASLIDESEIMSTLNETMEKELIPILNDKILPIAAVQ